MSTNKTQNYRLHSWVPQDEFHVSEVNENFALLDAVLKDEARKLSRVDADAARVTEIVMDETGVPASQIKIIPAEG